MVTGATAGIGKQTALELARMGAHVVIVGRNAEKVSATQSEIQQITANAQVEGLVADLSRQADVRALAQTLKQRYPRIDVLLNNAGAIFTTRQVSADGIEMTWALNHLNYFLLTDLLLDTLRASAPARIVNVASDAHQAAKINFDDVQFKTGYSAFGVYGQSKLANIMFTYELARRLAGSGVTANCLHPGMVATNFGANSKGVLGLVFKAVTRVAGISVQRGAQTSVYLASAPEVEGVSGKYFSNSKEARSSAASYIEADQQRLWQLTERMIQA